MVFVILLALSAAGCAAPVSVAPVSVAERTAPGLPGSLTQGQLGNLEPGEPAAFRFQAGSRFAMATWGSSTCPVVVTGIEAVGDDIISLELALPGDKGPCSADTNVMTHELEVPASVTRRPVILVLHYADGTAARTLVLHWDLQQRTCAGALPGKGPGGTWRMVAGCPPRGIGIGRGAGLGVEPGQNL